jgi:hypothetical protein
MTIAPSPIGREGEPGAECQCRLELNAVERDLQVGARQTDPVNAARHFRSRLAERVRDRVPSGLVGEHN